MEADKAKQVAIGQFSKMTRLSVKALRLYDENDLLPPTYVDQSTGYRYYNLDQAKHALQALMAHKERLAEKLATQERMLTYLETIIRNKEITMPQEIEITQATPQPIASVRTHTSMNGIKDAIGNSFSKLMPALAGAGQTPSGAPMTIYHDLIDQETDGDIEVCVPVATAFADTDDVVGRELAGGEMATSVHRGPYEEIGPVYQSLISWIADNGYEIAGPPREVYLNDPSMVTPGEILTRVDFPVSAATK